MITLERERERERERESCVCHCEKESVNYIIRSKIEISLRKVNNYMKQNLDIYGNRFTGGIIKPDALDFNLSIFR